MTMVQWGFPSDEPRDEHGRGLPHAFDRPERALNAAEEGERMARSVLYMSMSLDGFITGPDDGPDNGLGTGGPGCTSGSASLSPTTRTSTRRD